MPKKEKSKAKKSKQSKDDAKKKDPQKDPQKDKWYSEGLQFECSQCGDCCSGAPGYVWVDQEEVQAMADEMDMHIDAFEGKFIRKIGKDKSLIEYPDGDCIMLDPRTRKCLVYNGRPTQCRTWPFWNSNLMKKKDWKETCEVCPGSGKGRLYSFDEIEVSRKEKSV